MALVINPCAPFPTDKSRSNIRYIAPTAKRTWVLTNVHPLPWHLAHSLGLALPLAPVLGLVRQIKSQSWWVASPFTCATHYFALHRHFYTLPIVQVSQSNLVWYDRVLAFPWSSTRATSAHAKIEPKANPTTKEAFQKVFVHGLTCLCTWSHATHTHSIVCCTRVWVKENFVPILNVTLTLREGDKHIRWSHLLKLLGGIWVIRVLKPDLSAMRPSSLCTNFVLHGALVSLHALR